MSPMISIVMPIHNGEKYLEECLNSIIKQSLSSFELICVLNGSTDSSKDILDKYIVEDNRIKYIELSKGNAGYARNEGLNLVSGEYTLFLDCDDFFEYNFLECLYKKATNSGADITICNAYFYNDRTKRNTLSNFYINKKLIKNKSIVYTKDFNTNICDITSTVVWNRLYKTDFLKKSEIKFQEITSCNDMFFSVITLLLSNYISIVNTPLIHYRINHNYSITTKHSQSYSDIITVVKGIEKYRYEHPELNCFVQSLYKLYINHIIAHYVKITDNTKKELMKKEFEEINLDVSELKKICIKKRAYKIIFKNIFIKNRSTFLTNLICKSKYVRGIINLV